MSGNGPAPTGRAARRNTVKLEQLIERGERHAGAPQLPAKYRTRGAKGKATQLAYLKETRAWFEDWACSPLANQFATVHWNRLVRLAKVVDRYERYGDLDDLKEIRLQEAAFGGTPADARRLGKTVVAVEESEPPSDEGADASAPAKRRGRGGGDPRGVLSVVE